MNNPKPKPEQMTPERRLSYGENYVANYGLKGAQKRIAHLRARFQEELDRRNVKSAENISQEQARIQAAIDKVNCL